MQIIGIFDIGTNYPKVNYVPIIKKKLNKNTFLSLSNLSYIEIIEAL